MTKSDKTVANAKGKGKKYTVTIGKIEWYIVWTSPCEVTHWKLYVDNLEYWRYWFS